MNRPLDQSAGNARDHLDLEVEARKPVDADRRPVRIGLGEDLALDGHDRGELPFGVGMRRTITSTMSSSPHPPACKVAWEIGECQADLGFEIRLRASRHRGCRPGRTREQITRT